MIADAHIYDRHIPLIKELIEREPLPAANVLAQSGSEKTLSVYNGRCTSGKLRDTSADQKYRLQFKEQKQRKEDKNDECDCSSRQQLGDWEQEPAFDEYSGGYEIFQGKDKRSCRSDGRKTLESFPNGLPLKNRTNIVLTGNRDYKVKDAVIVHTKDELLEELKKYDSEEIYIIGGESVYRMMLPYCDTAYITKIDHAYEADTHFPNLDELEDWKMTQVSDEQTCFDLEYVFQPTAGDKTHILVSR